MTRLLKYYFTKKWILIAILAFAALQVTLISTTTTSYVYHSIVDSNLNIWMDYAKNPPIVIPTVIAAVLATIIPFVEFSFKMRKVNIDQYYSLPIKREKLYLATYIFGFIEVMIPTFVSYLASYISVFTKESMFENIYFLPYFLILILITLIVYTIITFVYTRNNTFYDGLINVVLIIFALCIFVGAINSIFEAVNKHNINNLYLDASWYILYSPHTYLSSMFSELLCKGYLTYYANKSGIILISLSIFAIAGISSFALFIKLIKQDKAENCSQISTSYISYKVMIPLYVISAMLLLRSTSIFVLIIVSIAAFFLYVLYHRTFKIKKHSIIVLAASCVLGLILAIVFEEMGSQLILEDPFAIWRFF